MSQPPSRLPLFTPTGPKSSRQSSVASRFANWQPHLYASSFSQPVHRRHPILPSPLHHQVSRSPAMPSISEPNSPPAAMEPERAPRSTVQGRPRGESRSSSVPILRLPHGDEAEHSEPRSRLVSGDSSQVVASSSYHRRGHSSSEKAEQSPSSVKHLTCFWWKEKGHCKFSDDQCLYAHYDTGRYTDAPRKVFEHEPAKAGRSLERALTKLAVSNRSSVSVSSKHPLESRSPSRPQSSMSLTSAGDTGGGVSINTESHHPLDLSRTPSPNDMVTAAIVRVRYDNSILQDMIADMYREKMQMTNTIETLTAEISELKQLVTELTQAKELAEKERNIMADFRLQCATPHDFDRLSPLTYAAPSRPSPFGPIGSDRLTAEAPAQQSRAVGHDFPAIAQAHTIYEPSIEQRDGLSDNLLINPARWPHPSYRSTSPASASFPSKSINGSAQSQLRDPGPAFGRVPTPLVATKESQEQGGYCERNNNRDYN